jgi:hypothetical protein
MKKKYTLLITDGYDMFVESFIDYDMDVVVKQTAQYKMEKLSNKTVFYILLIDGKRADQATWDMFTSKYDKYVKVLSKIKSLNKDFEC